MGLRVEQMIRRIIIVSVPIVYNAELVLTVVRKCAVIFMESGKAVLIHMKNLVVYFSLEGIPGRPQRS